MSATRCASRPAGARGWSLHALVSSAASHGRSSPIPPQSRGRERQRPAVGLRLCSLQALLTPLRGPPRSTTRPPSTSPRCSPTTRPSAASSWRAARRLTPGTMCSTPRCMSPPPRATRPSAAPSSTAARAWRRSTRRAGPRAGAPAHLLPLSSLPLVSGRRRSLRPPPPRHAFPAQVKSTPLHIAAQSGHTAVCRFLVAAGAPLGVADQFGRTPSDCASGESIKTLLADALREEEYLVRFAAAAAPSRPQCSSPRVWRGLLLLRR